MYCRALQSYHQDYFVLMPSLKIGKFLSCEERVWRTRFVGVFLTVFLAKAFYKCEYSFGPCSRRLNTPNSFMFYIQNNVV